MPYDFLGLLDLSGIQNYIYREPRLKQIAIRSAYIEGLGREDDDGLYHAAAKRHGAEVLVAAGGNASFLAADRETLCRVFGDITRDLLARGEGLFAVTHIEARLTDDTLPKMVQRSLQHVETRKFTQSRDTRFTFPGLSPESVSKMKKSLPRNDEPLDLDKLICGSREQSGLMAVVSVDGLRMGKKAIDWLHEWQTRTDTDDVFITEYRGWSGHLKTRWEAAWQAAKTRLWREFGVTGKGETPKPMEFLQADRPIHLQRDGKNNDEAWLLCCRRIYQGGDDLTFVCDARVALSLTVFLMGVLQQRVPVKGQETLADFAQIPTSAGIVFVGRSFPFARAADMADTVRKSAKIVAVQEGDGKPACSTLDWWMNRQGMSERPHPLFDGASLKPYRLETRLPVNMASHVTGQTNPYLWNDVETMHGSLWAMFAERRGKWKSLTEQVEAGDKGESVRRYLALHPITEHKEPFADWPGNVDKITGFDGDKTPLLDLAELFDVHYPFDPKNEEAQN